MEINTRTHEPGRPRILMDMIERLQAQLSERLRSVVLYGSAARGERYLSMEGPQLMLILSDLEAGTLRALSDPIHHWLKKDLPMPKLFSLSLLENAADVFPLEFLEIESHHELLFGRDPFSGMQIRSDQLRLQCEREFREKMMRLREGYLECHGSERRLRRLLCQSYPDFVDIFRGCLRLAASPPPLHDEDVVRRFCTQAGILHAPFAEIHQIIGGQKKSRRSDDELFSSYYLQLTSAVESIDSFQVEKG